MTIVEFEITIKRTVLEDRLIQCVKNLVATADYPNTMLAASGWHGPTISPGRTHWWHPDESMQFFETRSEAVVKEFSKRIAAAKELLGEVG